jgi:UDPglucose 6-dehydrogenase
MVLKIEDALKPLHGRTIAVLGLAFKPNTDDMREAPSLVIINNLLEKGARIKASDPASLAEAKWRFSNNGDFLSFFFFLYEAMKDADALVIITEWNQYRNLDFDRVKKQLKTPVLFDLRNIYKRASLEEKGFQYYAVGQ